MTKALESQLFEQVPAKEPKKIFINQVFKKLIIISFCFIFVFVSLVVASFFYSSFRLKSENEMQSFKRTQQLFTLYTAQLFNLIENFVNHSDFVAFLKLNQDQFLYLDKNLISNFPRLNENGVIGYKVVNSNNFILHEQGKESQNYFVTQLCYKNDKMNVKSDVCLGSLTVFMNNAIVLQQLKNSDSNLVECKDCLALSWAEKTIVNGFYLEKVKDLTFPVQIKVKDHSGTIDFFNFCLFILISVFLVYILVCTQIIRNYFYFPFIRLYDCILNKRSSNNLVLEENIDIAKKIVSIEDEMQSEILRMENENQSKLKLIANQISSPLNALNVFLGSSRAMPEDSQVLMRTALHRIQDSLYEMHFKNILNPKSKIAEYLEDELNGNEPHSIMLLSLLLEELVHEKRHEYKINSQIEILLEFGENSYGLFVNVQTNLFRFLLNNLIQKAIDTLPNAQGTIGLSLNSNQNFVNLEINVKLQEKFKMVQRNSIGNWKKVKSRDFDTYDAKYVVESWGGDFESQAQVDLGSVFKIMLPKSTLPFWFLSSLKLRPQSKLVVIDDDMNTHLVWQVRIRSEIFEKFNIQVLFFYSPKEFLEWRENEKFHYNKNIYIVCEAKYVDVSCKLNCFITQIGLENNAVLLVKNISDRKFIAQAEKLNLRLLIKSFSWCVPIDIIESKEKPLAILVEKDSMVQMVWHMAAVNRKVVCYDSLEKFYSEFERYDPMTHIFIDSHIDGNGRYEEFTEQIHSLGFKYIFVITNHDPKYFSIKKHIKAVMSKEPPWQVIQ